MTTEETARLIAQRILHDLTDRRGYDSAWDDTDADVRQEMQDSLAKIVLDTMKESVE